MIQEDLNKMRSRNKAVLGSLLTQLLYSTRINKKLIQNNLTKISQPTDAQARAVRVLEQAMAMTQAELRTGKGGKLLDQAYIAKEKIESEYFKVTAPQMAIVGFGPGTKTLSR